jgi:hypothetical protein
MPKLFQVYEDDLAELERSVPMLMNTLAPHLNAVNRVQLRRIKSILSNIRWEYGPPEQVEIIPAGDDE